MLIAMNGTPTEVAEGRRLTDLLAEMSVPVEHVAVEHNGEILDRADLAGVVLRAADRLEVVRFVGGG
jgi:sulfur carrier protein